MKPRLVALAALIITCWGCSESLLAEENLPLQGEQFLQSTISPLAQNADGWPDYPAAKSGGEHGIDRGPGGYFSPIKLVLLIVVFLIWVRLVDFINRDATQFGEHTGQTAEIWNPISVFTFVGGLIAVLCIPQFLAGYPVYLAAAFLPFGIYMLQRKGKIPAEAKTGELFAESIDVASKLPIDLKAAGKSRDEKQGNLIKARQSPVFEQVAEMLYEAARTRVEQILLDFTRDTVSRRMQVDGLWHPMSPLDRETGDAILWTLKVLADLNPGERRQLQKNVFDGSYDREKVEFELICQGTKTGERVLIKVVPSSSLKLDLTSLGMTDEMIATLMGKIAGPGMVIISAPPGQGLTSTWQSTLNNADRFTRDFVGVAEADDRETERENIEIKRVANGQSASELLPSMILREPNAFVMPKIADKATMELMTEQAASDERTVITKVAANNAVEALLRLMAVSSDRSRFVRSVTVVINQRLVRRLCDKCKTPVQVKPQAIRQLGGDPHSDTVLYKDYQLPPVEQRLDEEGKPVEMEPCRSCTGIGFQGRTAIYECLVVNDAMREALLKNPKLDFIGQVARQQGNLTLLQQAYRAVLEGRTSMSEVQRVFQPKK